MQLRGVSFFAVSSYLLLPQQLAQSVAGQRFGGELHSTDALIQRQAAVHLGDEGPDLFLLVLGAEDDGTNFLALLLHDALGDGRAEGQLLYFKKPKQGMALTALAGPVSNFLLALLLLLIARGPSHPAAQRNSRHR